MERLFCLRRQKTQCTILVLTWHSAAWERMPRLRFSAVPMLARSLSPKEEAR